VSANDTARYYALMSHAMTLEAEAADLKADAERVALSTVSAERRAANVAIYRENAVVFRRTAAQYAETAVRFAASPAPGSAPAEAR
jgi:hypothetical protein